MVPNIRHGWKKFNKRQKNGSILEVFLPVTPRRSHRSRLGFAWSRFDATSVAGATSGRWIIAVFGTGIARKQNYSSCSYWCYDQKRKLDTKVCAQIHLQVTFCQITLRNSLLVFWFIKFSRCIMLIQPSRTQIDRNHEWFHKVFKSNDSPLQKWMGTVAQTGNIEVFNLVFVAQKILTATRQKSAQSQGIAAVGLLVTYPVSPAHWTHP